MVQQPIVCYGKVAPFCGNGFREVFFLLGFSGNVLAALQRQQHGKKRWR